MGGGPREFNVFPGVVEDGVWKIDVSPSVTEDRSRPNVELISPTIGHDSSLFDQIWVRFRTVHHSPTVGSFSLTWTNEHNLMPPVGDQDDLPERLFRLSGQRDFVYTTEWQEVGVFLRRPRRGRVGGSIKGYSAEFCPRLERGRRGWGD